MRAPTLNHDGARARQRSLGVAWYWLHAVLPRRWRGWLLLGVLVGLLSGGVLAALAGASRTESAYRRFLDANEAWDVGAAISCDPEGPAPRDELDEGTAEHGPPPPSAAEQEECVQRVRALPSVADATTVNIYGAQFAPVGGNPVQPTGDPCYSGPGLVYLIGDPTGRLGTELNRFTIVDGRAADPTAVDEVIVSREMARRLDLRPGDALHAALVPYDSCLDDPAGWPAPMRLTVVGIGVGAGEVRPSSGFFISFVTTTPAFVQAAGDDALDQRVAMVRLRRGPEGVDAFVADAEGAGARAEPQLAQADFQADLERGLGPPVQALQILGALAAVAGAAVLGQVLIRQTALEAIDLPQLRSLGSSRRERFAVAVIWTAPVGAVAALTAVLAAALLSWFTPVGTARIVEPDPGVSVDVRVLGLGGLVTAAAVLVLAALPAVRLARAASEAERAIESRPSRTVAALAGAAFPPPAVTGVRMALEPGRGRSAVPVRSSLLAIAVGVLTLTAAVTFGAGLAKLLDTPRLVGWNWDSWIPYPHDDAAAGGAGAPVDRAAVIDALAANPGIAAFGIGTVFTPGIALGDDPTEIDPIGTMAFDPGAGTVRPSLVEGREPAAPDELLLGPVTADRLRLDIGDEILVHGLPDEFAEPGTAATSDVTMGVVGLGVLPFAAGDRLGTGAAVTTDGLRVLSGMDQPDSLFLRFAPGSDPPAVARQLIDELGLDQPDAASLEEELSPLVDAIPVLDVRQVDRLPFLLGALMVAMSLAVLAHVLVSAVSARREELALLRAIGFSRGQVRRTVAWQAATIAFVALVVGVPLGVVVGRGVWLVFAERLGVVPEAVAPWSILLIVPLLLLAALAVATVPGWLAARSRPAAILRAE